MRSESIALGPPGPGPKPGPKPPGPGPNGMPPGGRLDFFPSGGVVGGFGGIDLYRRFFDDLPRVLASDGLVLCECGFTQSGALEQVASERGLRFVDRLDDLQGIPRTIVFGL